MLSFVYGTLTDPDTAESILESFTYEGPATLDGLHSVEGEYPALTSGGETAGRFLATEDVASLGRYEGVGRGLYVRRPDSDRRPCGQGPGIRRSPGCAGRVASWPCTGPFRDRVVSYLDEHAVSALPER